MIRSLYGQNGFAKPHIDSFNEFIEYQMQTIITSKLNKRITVESVPSFWMEYENIRVGHPTHERNYDRMTKESKLYPHEARILNTSYSADIHADIKYFLNGCLEERKSIKIGRMPIMLGSSKCNLLNKTKRELAYLKECPYDPKGYFIINGT